MEKSKGADVLRLQKSLMKVTGMWPQTKFSAMNLCSLIVVATNMLVTFAELVHVFGEYYAMSDVLSILISPSIYLVKHAIFICKRRKFLELLEALQDATFQNYPHHLDRYISRCIRTSTMLSTVYQVSCAVVIVLYSCKPFIMETYELPVRITFVDLESYRYPVHFWQSCGLFLAAWNNSCLDTVAVGLMMVGAAYYDILYQKIKHVRCWAGLPEAEIVEVCKARDENLDGQVEKSLKECVVYHKTLLNFLDLVEDVFSLGFLAQFFNSVIVICNTGFQAVIANPLSLQFAIMVAYFCAMLIQLSLYCWFGNELTVKSLQLREACYLSNWTSCGAKIRKSIFIIMERTKKPFYLTAGKFANLTLETYTAVIRSSYSYFALMQRLYVDKMESA